MQKEMENVLNFLEFDFREVIELYYLINMLDKLNIIDEAKESIFQFNPSYNEEGRNQKFSEFYKEIAINEIIFKILEKVYIQLKKDKEKNEKNNLLLNSLLKEQKEKIDFFTDEDFTDYFYLNEKYYDKFIKFIIKNNLLSLTEKEIVDKFQKENIIEFINFFN